MKRFSGILRYSSYIAKPYYQSSSDYWDFYIAGGSKGTVTIRCSGVSAGSNTMRLVVDYVKT